jgi:glycosyltransferase involved in cell wall biosynthesis
VTDRTPLVTVLLAAHDAQAYLEAAVGSAFRQTMRDLELLVVDDASTDETAAILAGITDPRLVVLRNERRSGLAESLNRGLDAARGRWIARLDADDVALPRRLERQLAAVEHDSPAILGSAVADIDERGDVLRVHTVPRSDAEVRWHALFSSPFYHPTVLLDRELLERHGLRYDTGFGESEDYDLWARMLELGSGRNLAEPLVFYRVHPGQASRKRRELQRDLQRGIALRQIRLLAPGLADDRAKLAWRLGVGERIERDELDDALAAYLALVDAFERVHPRYGAAARHAAARLAARLAREDSGSAPVLLRDALRLDPAFAPRAVARATRRRRAARRLPRVMLAAPAGPVRLTLVVPEPTPFRTEMLDRVAERPELDLTVLYAGSTVQRRTWMIEPRHRAVFLEGRRVPGLYRVLRHEYPISLGVFRALAASRPEVVVVSGWSTFASQAAAGWCRRRGVPYVLLVESNERDPRPGWRRAAKWAVVPPVLRGAAEVLVVGRLARESMLMRGVPPQRISLFADTIDVRHFGAEADRLRAHRPALRAEAGLAADDVAVLSVARLAREKGLDTLVRAVALARDPRLVLVLAGSGAERDRLAALAVEFGVQLVFLPDIPWERISERFAIADVFALLSRHEPWGVVVNEAAASGLPLVVSDRVGAAFDLLEDGLNGAVVPADDPVAAGEAIRALAADPERRRAAGRASRELMRGWGYEPSIDNLIRVARRVSGRS